MKFRLAAASIAAALVSSPVLAQTEIQWWHSMSGPLVWSDIRSSGGYCSKTSRNGR